MQNIRKQGGYVLRTIKKSLLLIVACICVFTFSAGVSAADVYTQHSVKDGESVYKIAKYYGVDMSAIVSANGLSDNGKWIYPGQKLLIDSNATSNPQGNYVVVHGDSLYKIANANGITIATLMAANGLTCDRIYAGQVLSVNGGGKSAHTPTVNAGAGLSLTEAEIYMMAKMIYGEARGESYRGQVAVGAVIINRIKSADFPNTMYGVLFQSRQFSAVDDGQYYMTPNATAIAAAREASTGVDPTYGALYYWNPVKAPNNAFLNSKQKTVTIGNHVFAK